MDTFMEVLFCPPGRHRKWEDTGLGRREWRGRWVLALRTALVNSPPYPCLLALCLLIPLVFVWKSEFLARCTHTAH